MGFLIGAGVAIALDATVLAHGERTVQTPVTGMPRVTSVAPTYDPRTRTAGVGIGGSF